jgi:hypothetical protein
VNNWTYEQIVKATMKGEIVPPIKIFEAQGAADERARIMAAVKDRRKYCAREETYSGSYLEALMWVEELLKDGEPDA